MADEDSLSKHCSQMVLELITAILTAFSSVLLAVLIYLFVAGSPSNLNLVALEIVPEPIWIVAISTSGTLRKSFL